MKGRRRPGLPIVASTIAVSLATPCRATEEKPFVPRDVSSEPPAATGTSEAQEAEGDDRRISVRLRAPARCATLEELKLGIARRAPHLDLVDDPAASKQVFADIHRAGGERSVTATLIIERPREATLERSIQAESCDEALEALAFMTAVALDPEGASREPAAPEPKGSPTRKPPAVHAEPVPAPTGWTPFVGGGVHAAWAVAPAPLLGPELLGGFEMNSESFVSPLVRLGATRVTRKNLQQAGGTAHFTLTTASLDLCPFNVVTSELALRPCGFVTAGMLLAEGIDTLDPQRTWRPWGVIGGSLIGIWTPFAPVRFSLTARLGRPLVRDAFEFEPETFHEVPSWAANAGGAVEVELP